MLSSQEVYDTLNGYLKSLGMEVYLFKLANYNEMVTKPFKFQFDGNTVCAVILTVPSFFEDAFLPYIRNTDVKSLVRDPIDSCIAFHVNKAVSLLKDENVTVMYDYELMPNRRPKVLVQTAAHVAGAAFYYQRKHALLNGSGVCSTTVHCSDSVTDVHFSSQAESGLQSEFNNNDVNCAAASTDPWDAKKKIFGACIHPRYGGWFAIRTVLIFHNLVNKNLHQSEPVDCVSTREQRIELLNRFNGNWQDWSYRDIISVEAKYSEIQRKYFATLPKDRLKLLSELALT